MYRYAFCWSVTPQGKGVFLFGFNSTLFSPCSLDRDESVTFLVIVFHPLSTRTRAPPSTRPRAPSRAPRLVHLRLRRALSQHGLQKRRLLRHRRRSRPRLHPHAFRAVSIRVVANRNLPKPTSERVRVHSRGRRIPIVAESPRERRARRLDAHPRTIPRRAKVTRGGPERARLRRGEPRARHVRRRESRARLRVHGFRRGGDGERCRSSVRVAVRVRVGI